MAADPVRNVAISLFWYGSAKSQRESACLYTRASNNLTISASTSFVREFIYSFARHYLPVFLLACDLQKILIDFRMEKNRVFFYRLESL